MKNKEDWIEKTLASLDGLTPARSDTFFTLKVLARIEKSGKTVPLLRPAVVWPVAACLALLLGFNILTMVHFDQSGQQNSSAASLAGEFFPYMKTMNF